MVSLNGGGETASDRRKTMCRKCDEARKQPHIDAAMLAVDAIITRNDGEPHKCMASLENVCAILIGETASSRQGAMEILDTLTMRVMERLNTAVANGLYAR